MRRLRGGTGSASAYAVAAHNLNRVFFAPTGAERSLLDLSIEFLIFPNFEPLFHKFFEQPNRIAPSFPRGFFKAIP
jgi:hypothetical protein